MLTLPISPEHFHAIAIAGKPAAKLRDKLKVGKRRIDFTVRIHGDLVVNADETKAATKSISTSELLAGVLAHFGPRKRKSIVDEILAARPAKGYKIDEAANDEAARLIRETQIHGTATRRGAVTGKLTAEIV